MAKSGLRLMDRDLENGRGSSVHLGILMSKHHQAIGVGGFGDVPYRSGRGMIFAFPTIRARFSSCMSRQTIALTASG